MIWGNNQSKLIGNQRHTYQIVASGLAGEPPAQISPQGQAVLAPADLSARSDSRQLTQPAVGGSDHCDQPADKVPASCRDAVEARAQDFAREQRQDPEDRMLEAQRAESATRNRGAIDPTQRTGQEVASIVFNQVQAANSPTTAVAQDPTQQALIDAVLKVAVPGR